MTNQSRVSWISLEAMAAMCQAAGVDTAAELEAAIKAKEPVALGVWRRYLHAQQELDTLTQMLGPAAARLNAHRRDWTR